VPVLGMELRKGRIAHHRNHHHRNDHHRNDHHRNDRHRNDVAICIEQILRRVRQLKLCIQRIVSRLCPFAR